MLHISLPGACLCSTSVCRELPCALHKSAGSLPVLHISLPGACLCSISVCRELACAPHQSDGSLPVLHISLSGACLCSSPVCRELACAPHQSAESFPVPHISLPGACLCSTSVCRKFDCAPHQSDGSLPVLHISLPGACLCSTSVCQEIAVLERPLKDDLHKWSYILTQFLKQERFESGSAALISFRFFSFRISLREILNSSILGLEFSYSSWYCVMTHFTTARHVLDFHLT